MLHHFDSKLFRSPLPYFVWAIASLPIATASCLLPTQRDASENASVRPANFTNLATLLGKELDKQVYCGGEPASAAAFEHLKQLAVKTIVSVDGARPALQLAKARGMRYVHIPLSYSGIEAEQGLALAEVLRKLPGPIYVHCHHGKHRAPAAAAWMLRSTNQISPTAAERILTSCGTNPDYTGLWRAVQEAEPLPASAAELELKEFVEVSSVALQMAELARHWDQLTETSNQIKLAERRASALIVWETHRELLRRLDEAEEANAKQLRPGLREGTRLSKKLYDRLQAGKNWKSSQPLIERVRDNCQQCHEQYRN